MIKFCLTWQIPAVESPARGIIWVQGVPRNFSPEKPQLICAAPNLGGLEGWKGRSVVRRFELTLCHNPPLSILDVWKTYRADTLTGCC